MLKVINKTLDSETKQHYQKRVFRVFSQSYLPKQKIAFETSFMWEKK